MTRKTDIPICAWCSKPLPQAKKTGRPRRYCDDICRLAAFRHRELVASFDASSLEPAGASQRPRMAGDSDEQVARAILSAQSAGNAFVTIEGEAREIGEALIRLGLDARPEFAWRCEKTGRAIIAAVDGNHRAEETGVLILAALEEFFKEALR